MIQSLLIDLWLALLGFAGGLAVGAGFVAFITVLGVIPRLVQIARAQQHIRLFGSCAVAGALLGTYLSFTTAALEESVFLLAFWGLFHGIFNGMLAAGLTEVINVIPILSRRLGMQRHFLSLLMAIVFGKIAGSLFQWLVFVR